MTEADAQAVMTARELLRVYNEHDVEGAKELFTPDAEFRALRSAIDGRVYRGPQGVVKFWFDTDDVWRSVRIESPEVCGRAGEALVVATIVLEAHGSGALTRRPVAIHIEVDEQGLCSRMVTLIDIESARRDFGNGCRPEPG